jgi:hypothetical protein
VGWTVAGWAPGEPRIEISCRFQSMTDCPDPGLSATAVRGAVPAEVGASRETATPAAVAVAARVRRREVGLRMPAALPIV